jgi:predicted nuclease of restriction endonuclease-like (RecB) superfamily
MKIRHGFVSNSSSSSFLILGNNFETEFTKEEFEEYKKDYNLDFNYEDYSIMERDIEYGAEEALENILLSLGYKVVYME